MKIIITAAFMLVLAGCGGGSAPGGVLGDGGVRPPDNDPPVNNASTADALGIWEFSSEETGLDEHGIEFPVAPTLRITAAQDEHGQWGVAVLNGGLMPVMYIDDRQWLAEVLPHFRLYRDDMQALVEYDVSSGVMSLIINRTYDEPDALPLPRMNILAPRTYTGVKVEDYANPW